jgi:multiple antibiotic resistance protein
MVDDIVKFFVLFFVVVEPLTLVPVFAALTEGATPEFRRHVAWKAVLVAGGICTLFAIGGAQFLRFMGISLDAFRIGGGILLFLIALDMVFARISAARATTTTEEDESRHRQDISVFPLAFPLITGPGAMATVILAFGETGKSWIVYAGQFLAMLIVLAIALILMRLTTRVMRVLGVTGGNVVSRLSGVILAALAVQFIIDGLRGAFVN